MSIQSQTRGERSLSTEIASVGGTQEPFTDKLRRELQEARSGMNATRQGRNAFLSRELTLWQTLVYRLTPNPVKYRLIPGYREYALFEGYSQTREQKERQIAEEQKAAENQARAARAVLFAQAPVGIDTGESGERNGKSKFEEVNGGKIGAGSRRRNRKEMAQAQIEIETAQNQEPRTPANTPETEEVFPFKLVKLQRQMIGTSSVYSIVEDGELVKKDLDKYRAKIAEKSQNKAVAFDVMVRHLKRTGGIGPLASEEASHTPAGKIQRGETISIGYKVYSVRSLKPNGIEGNPLNRDQSRTLRIKYVLIPGSNAISILKVIDDREKR